MNTSDLEKRLTQDISDLSPELSPNRDLWPGIEKAINKPVQTERNRAPWLVAASVIMAVTVGWFANQQTDIDSHSLVASVEANFAMQKQAVSLQYTNAQEISPEAAAEFTKARETILEALAEDPNNPALLEILKYTQQRELELMHQINRPQWQQI